MGRKGLNEQTNQPAAETRGDNPVDQPETRMIFSAVAMHGMLAGRADFPQLATPEQMADAAVGYADALITALRR